MKMYEFWIFFIEGTDGSNEQYSWIGLDNGLALTRQQSIIWTNDV